MGDQEPAGGLRRTWRSTPVSRLDPHPAKTLFDMSCVAYARAWCCRATSPFAGLVPRPTGSARDDHPHLLAATSDLLVPSSPRDQLLTATALREVCCATSKFCRFMVPNSLPFLYILSFFLRCTGGGPVWTASPPFWCRSMFVIFAEVGPPRWRVWRSPMWSPQSVTYADFKGF